jgi:hypothetical protein
MRSQPPIPIEIANDGPLSDDALGAIAACLLDMLDAEDAELAAAASEESAA